MKKSKLMSLAACLSFASILLLTQIAEARIYIQVDQVSEKKFPVAVDTLHNSDGGGSSRFSERIAELVEKNLNLTGLFDLVPQSQFPSGDKARSGNPSTIDFPAWTLVGAQALVSGTYTRASGGTKVDLYLSDPALGQKIIGHSYVTNDKDLTVVANHFSDQVVKALTGEEGVFSTKIAFVQASKKNKEIGVMDMNGENVKILTRDRSINLSPAWSPDGGLIAYTAFKNNVPEIAVMSSGGGSTRKVTSNGTINLSPAWSSQGAFSVVSALSGDTDIYLMNLGGKVLKNLTNSFGIDVNPSWSPDGSSFTFSSERAGRVHVFKADASGGNVQRLTFVGSQNDNPAWSPKGDKIVFQSLTGGWDLFIVNTDGSNLQRLTSGGGNESPTWAPNGRFIGYSCSGRICLMRDDGANSTPVGPGGSFQPAWSPQSK